MAEKWRYVVFDSDGIRVFSGTAGEIKQKGYGQDHFAVRALDVTHLERVGEDMRRTHIEYVEILRQRSVPADRIVSD